MVSCDEKTFSAVTGAQPLNCMIDTLEVSHDLKEHQFFYNSIQHESCPTWPIRDQYRTFFQNTAVGGIRFLLGGSSAFFKMFKL